MGISLSGKLPVRAHGNEVDVKTLVSATIFGKAVAVALKVFEIYSPALFLGIVPEDSVKLNIRRALRRRGHQPRSAIIPVYFDFLGKS
ncbi:hypothetical protein [Bradyrhizobium iriomotense]|uniref:Uncharacterized protein n=1 Tax=Bradyrhizobium iriomotense TaxID=441950 RepID=A0ABQ6B5V8_9BRAD|nr:hypothetical protein [Bradyrhizobium iriomotense]GLR87996.1 hypothetical protein GCM10007857_47080 [Bradyrhizobium iriomotense]